MSSQINMGQNPLGDNWGSSNLTSRNPSSEDALKLSHSQNSSKGNSNIHNHKLSNQNTLTIEKAKYSRQNSQKGSLKNGQITPIQDTFSPTTIKYATPSPMTTAFSTHDKSPKPSIIGRNRAKIRQPTLKINGVT